jgi:hypothetical protein
MFFRWWFQISLLPVVIRFELEVSQAERSVCWSDGALDIRSMSIRLLFSFFLLNHCDEVLYLFNINVEGKKKINWNTSKGIMMPYLVVTRTEKLPLASLQCQTSM